MENDDFSLKRSTRKLPIPNRGTAPRLATVFVLLLLSMNAWGQSRLHSNFLDDPSLSAFSSTIRRLEMPVGLSILPVDTWSEWNSALPNFRNDGIMIPSRGLSQYASAGITYTGDWWSASLVPEFSFSQNNAFPTRSSNSGIAPWGNYGTNIDAPQRFGDDPVFDASLGHTQIGVHHRDWQLWAGSGHIRMGPGAQTQLVMSENAPPFLHIGLGTRTPIETRIGQVDALLFWGRVNESDFFDFDSANDFRLLVGGSLWYAPSVLPGLSVGMHRSIISPWETRDLYKTFQVFEVLFKNNRRSYADTPTGEDDTDQVISVSLEYLLRDPEIRVYLEYGRNDHAASLEDLILNPEHTRGFVTGFRYGLAVGETAHLAINGEIGVINRTPTAVTRPASAWYRHGPVAQGYTHEGQYLGAFFGSGGNTQYADVTLTNQPWSAQLFLQRIVFDNDYFYSITESTPPLGYRNASVRTTVGVNALLRHQQWTFEAGYSVGFQYNWLWLTDQDIVNHGVHVGVTYQP